jgi:DMSO reductase anchor subunit
MQEKQRIITVIIAVIVYNLLDQFILKFNHGITIWSVIISIVIAGGLYLALIYFFGKKHLN